MKYIKIVLMISMVIAFRGYSQLWGNLGGGFANADSGGPLVFYVDEISGNLIMGGGFWQGSSGDTLARIAQWDGENLMPMNCGFDWDCLPNETFYFGNVISLIRYNGDLLASGSFQSSCGVPIGSIAKFNGECWENFGPIDWIVPEFKIHEDTLYACGIDTCGGLDCNGFGKWNGNTWLPVHNLPNFSLNEIGNNVQTCEWYQGNLYLGGNWSYPGSDFNYSDLIMWNGESWTPVGSGLSGSFSLVRKLTVFQDKLIALGGFQGPANPGNFIAAWDGQNWDDMDGGLMNMDAPSAYQAVYDMWATDDYLYVVGHFYYAGGFPAHGIARWDGENWCGYGSGNAFPGGHYWENVIHSVCVYNGNLIIGGDFMAAQDHPNLNLLAQYIGPDSCLFTGISEPHYKPDVTLFPNPSSDVIQINGLKSHEILSTHLYDDLGQLVKEISLTTEINIKHLASGVYVLVIDTQHGRYQLRFVKE